jgi:hypothetical protein
MKRSILILACALFAQLVFAQEAAAFPGERLPYRAAHFAQKVAYKIDKHVIQPTRHVVVRHLPG